MRRALVVGLLTVAGVVAGCDDASDLTPGPEAATGRFAVTDGDVGVTLDFTGFDPVSRRIRAGLPPGASRWSIGIASIVNRTTGPIPVPTFVATRPDGRVTRVRRATRMRTTDGRNVDVPGPRAVIAADGAATVYVVFRGPVSEIRRVEMRIGSEPPVRLDALPAPEGSGAGE